MLEGAATAAANRCGAEAFAEVLRALSSTSAIPWRGAGISALHTVLDT